MGAYAGAARRRVHLVTEWKWNGNVMEMCVIMMTVLARLGVGSASLTSSLYSTETAVIIILA